MSATDGPLRVGERVTVLTRNDLDSVQLCLSPNAIVAEVLQADGETRYRLRYPDGEPGNFGAPVLRERLYRGWL